MLRPIWLKRIVFRIGLDFFGIGATICADLLIMALHPLSPEQRLHKFIDFQILDNFIGYGLLPR